MRQTYVAGDKLFVDWAGGRAPIIDPMTGEVHEAHLFVAVLGASSYTYAEARWSETLPDWIGAHVNALDFFGGVPKAAVPDNLSAGIRAPRSVAGSLITRFDRRRERRSARSQRLSAIIGTLSGLRRNPVRNASESAPPSPTADRAGHCRNSCAGRYL